MLVTHFLVILFFLNIIHFVSHIQTHYKIFQQNLARHREIVEL